MISLKKYSSSLSFHKLLHYIGLMCWPCSLFISKTSPLFISWFAHCISARKRNKFSPSLFHNSTVACTWKTNSPPFSFFFIQESLGELGPGVSPGPGQASRLFERLQRYLQIAYQQGPHIGGIQTHNHIVMSQTPLPTEPTFVGN